jgi:PKD repeat protein
MKRLILLCVISLLTGKLMAAGFTISPAPWCTFSTITFTDTTTEKTVVDWLWYFGDDSTFSGAATATHMYLNPGIYVVSCKLTYSDNATDSLSQEITVHGIFADFTADKRFKACPELRCQFSDASTGDSLSYQWNFGDTLPYQINISTDKDPLHIYAYAGHYDVSLIVIDKNGCSDTMAKENFIHVGGSYGKFYMDTISGNVPLRVTFSFDIDVANTDTLWIFYGDGTDEITTFVGAPMKHTYTIPGNYNPIMCLKKWVYDSLSGNLVKCITCFMSTDTIKIHDPSDIRSIHHDGKLHIYPNPSSDNFTLDNGQELMKEVSLYDVMGRKVKHLPVNAPSTTVDVSDLPNGIYVVKIITDEGIIIRKMQKHK